MVLMPLFSADTAEVKTWVFTNPLSALRLFVAAATKICEQPVD